MVHTFSLPLYKEGEIDFSARGLLFYTVEDALNVECAFTVLRQVLEGILVCSQKNEVVQIVKNRRVAIAEGHFQRKQQSSSRAYFGDSWKSVRIEIIAPTVREQVSATTREVPPECISETAIITNKLFATSMNLKMRL